MKKINILTACFLLFLANFSIAQEVPEIQRPLVSKVAATWCPPCGQWGWTFFEDLITDNEERATLIVAHHSGDLFNETSKAFSENFDAPYQPYFYINTTDQNVTASNAVEKRVEVKNAVDAESMTSPIAGTIINAKLENNMLSAQNSTKFFQEANGDFYLGIYVVESGIMNFQEGQGANAIHEKVLRASFSENAFGYSLVNGMVGVDYGWQSNYSIPFSEDWNLENIEIVSIIWKKEDNKYIAINTAVQEEIEIVSAISNIEENISLQVLPNIFSVDARIELDLVNSLSNVTLEITDIDGKTIARLYDGNLNAGKSNFPINRTDLNQAGMYFLVLRSSDRLVTRKIIAE